MSIRIARGCLLAAALALLGGSVSRSAPREDGEPPPPGILQEIALPPVGLPGAKAKEPDFDLKGTSGKKYADKENPQSRYCKAIHLGRVVLWASSTLAPPKRLGMDVLKMRKELKLTPRSLEHRFVIPVNARAEMQLKARALVVSQSIARVMARMEDALEELKGSEEEAGKRPLRWQANHALVRSALLLRIAHLEEFSLALGSLRKELPPHGKDDRAWQLKATATIHDISARKRVKEAVQLLKQLRTEHAGTAWDQQAEHLGRAMLGVEWEAVK
jgi:hypothetical protein